MDEAADTQRRVRPQVLSGSMLRVFVLDGFYQITLMLSGIQCNGIRRNEDGTEEALPFAREARYFVETRLLNRDVQVGRRLRGVVASECAHAERPRRRDRRGVIAVPAWSRRPPPPEGCCGGGGGGGFGAAA